MTRRESRAPVKTTINLAQRERKQKDLGAVAVTAVILAIAIGLFCKYGVVDRLRALDQAETQAEEQEALVAKLQTENRDYDAVLEEYQSSAAAQNITGGGPDPMECLSLMESDLLSRSEVSSFTISNAAITVKLSGVTLNEISAMYSDLMSSSLVSGVQVYTAAADGGAQVVEATLTVDLKSTELAADSGEGAAS